MRLRSRRSQDEILAERSIRHIHSVQTVATVAWRKLRLSDGSALPRREASAGNRITPRKLPARPGGAASTEPSTTRCHPAPSRRRKPHRHCRRRLSASNGSRGAQTRGEVTVIQAQPRVLMRGVPGRDCRDHRRAHDAGVKILCGDALPQSRTQAPRCASRLPAGGTSSPILR